MGFSPAGGAISGADDVFLSNPAANELMTYDAGLGMWRNVLAPVRSVAGKTGQVTLTKADAGLDNVDNTSDADKPISSLTQAALDTKATTSSLATVATSGSYSDLTGKPTIPTITVSSTAPGSPSVGDIWIDTSA